jgi:hypothetical protein
MHCDFVSDFCPLAMSTEQSKMLRTNNDTFCAHCEVPPRVGNSLSLCSKTRAGYRKSIPSYTIGRLLINEGVTMSNLGNVLQQIRDERKQAQLRMEQLDQVIRAIVIRGLCSNRRNA